ncbi:hypothetical protein [Paenibacillus hamazuiensis]|uniref:hypothetical protein n=1 Tax=Paenibacillus hamazuiensis TaxID=2936508 RepID=UPI00200D6829|nr:hypothetical protein [Paenibacillus hamazuiensis]
MNEKKAAVWRKRRELGRKRYVLLNGLITWGLLATVLFSAIEWLSQGAVNWRWVVARLVVFGFIGSFITNIKWNSAEHQLTEYEQQTASGRG